MKLYCHGGSGNHGCEAIVRGTIKIINKPIELYSNHSHQDVAYGLNSICAIKKDENSDIKRGSISWILSKVETKLTRKIDYLVSQCRKKLICNATKHDIFLSIGGDNYCYAGTDILAAINNNIRKKGAKTVLWGCSVEPNVIKDEIVFKDLAGFDLITARETISYEALKKVNPNTYLFPDPAFQLDKIELPLPINFIEGNTVGINVSPLIMSCEINEGITRENYIQLIDYIIRNTDMNIALIPHVVWENNDDRKPLQELYDLFKDTNRVCLIEDHNCMELKGYISRCRFFVGARTHSTIAAYSTCVPTLVVGYSVKAKGIAKDIFGTYDNYVLPVQSLKEKDDLINAFKWMYNQENSIRKHLVEFMPEYKERALLAGEKVRELINK